MPDSPHELVADTVLARHSSPALTVELLWLGEGHHGDFDAHDPQDAPLVRFDAQLRNANGNCRHLTSWCTSLDARAPQHLLDAAARHIHDRLTDAVLTDAVKHTALELAQLHADEACLQQPCPPEHDTITITVSAMPTRFQSTATLVTVTEPDGSARTLLEDTGDRPHETLCSALGSLLPDETLTYADARQAATVDGAP